MIPRAGFVSFLLVSMVWANEPIVTAPIEPAPAPSSKTPVVKKKGRRTREIKEAEGTEALGRFEADTVIKSKYEHGGKPLEVDPD